MSALVAGGTWGCTKDSSSVTDKLDDIEKRLASIEGKLDKLPAGARPPQRRRPQQPDPNKVYSVPIAGAPFKGPEAAKVTMVEAFEFA
ncbi:MAG: hypothetical protein MJE77_05170 [Proteobacteria bacterium]|nr:hypothetical protein [Pseudomonadota bacterium]